MRVAIETSSLFPLFVFTSYTCPLYEELGKISNNGGEIIVHYDSLDEARQISIIQKTREVVSIIQRFHADNKLSFIRTILEHFPGNMFGNNSARAVALFALDVLDTIPYGLPYNDFKARLTDGLSGKVAQLEKRLTPINGMLNANPNEIQSYWYPRTNLLFQLPNLKIRVRENSEQPKSTKNKDRDIFHCKLAVLDGDIDKLIVCDKGFANQIPKELSQHISIQMLNTLSLSGLQRINRVE